MSSIVITSIANITSATTVVNVGAATAPTSGQVLTATSGTTATWQSLSVTLAGDVTGGSGTNTVAKISGTSPIAIGTGSSGYSLNFTSTVSPTISQTQAAGTVAGKTLTITAQSGGATSGGGGTLILQAGTGVGANTNGGTNIYSGFAVSTSTITSDPGVIIGSGILLQSNTLQGTILQVQCNNLGNFGNTSTALVSIGGNLTFSQQHFLTSAGNPLSPVISQTTTAVTSATGTTFTIQAQNASGTTSTGGALALTSGTGTTAAGNVNIQTGGTTAIQATPTQVNISPSGTTTYQFATLSGTKNTQALTILNQQVVLNTTSTSITTIFTYTVPNGAVISVNGNWTCRLASTPTGFAAGVFRVDGYCNAAGTFALATSGLQTIGGISTVGTSPANATPIGVSATTNVLTIKVQAVAATSTDWQMALQIQIN